MCSNNLVTVHHTRPQAGAFAQIRVSDTQPRLPCLLLQLQMLVATDEAVRAGLGGLLCELFKGCLVRRGGACQMLHELGWAVQPARKKAFCRTVQHKGKAQKPAPLPPAHAAGEALRCMDTGMVVTTAHSTAHHSCRHVSAAAASTPQNGSSQRPLTPPVPVAALQEGGELEEASRVLIHCGALVQGIGAQWHRRMDASSGREARDPPHQDYKNLAVGLCTQGLLRAAAEWSCQATSSQGSGRGREPQVQ